MKLTDRERDFFVNNVLELLQYEPIHRMKNYIQHGDTTTFDHSMSVAYYSYWLSLRLPVRADLRSIIRGSVLHDFYLYDWHIPDKSHKLHGYVHPKFALVNARKYFTLTSLEEDIIAKHMWPLTLLTIPRKKEAFLVCMVDKYVSFTETFYLPILPKEFRRLHQMFIDMKPNTT